MSAIKVFACFDVNHDGDLYERLVEEAGMVGLNIVVSGGSEPYASADDWNERVRRRIQGAERILVICGEHTESSMGVASELRIAQEEQKPYLLLWGRRGLMCTKPVGAKPAEGMYAWTVQTLQEQFALMTRVAQREEAADGMKRTAQARVTPQASAS